MAKVYFYGIDISNHQGKAGFDLDKVLTKHPECKVVIIKSSEGVNFDDAYDEKYIQIALKHNRIVGVYHFARPSRNSYKAEAMYFMSLTLQYKGKVFYILDWEDKGGASNAAWAKGFLDYVAKKTNSTPVFYSYESMINANNYSSFTKYPLWVAKYRDYDIDRNFDMSHAGTAPNVKWWSRYIAWQFTSVGRLDGYSGNLDCNAFYVDEAYLRKLINGDANKVEEKVLYTFPTTNPVKISNSGSDENGRYKGGKAGDQTGNEWRIRDWYNRPWNCILRHPNANVRATIAHLAILSAENDNIGYDQNQRQTYWEELKANGYDPSKITKACESDCSAGVIAIVKATGYLLDMKELQNIDATYTGNMRSSLSKAGFDVLTASKYTSCDDYLVAGDILLNDVHHVATAVTNGIYSGEKAKADSTMPLLKKGSKGKAVRFLQLILGGLDDDGSFGQLTKKAVIAKQKELGVEADGEVWTETWNALIPTLPTLKRGSKGRYVEAIQVALDIDADGSFGWGTTAAVTKIQSDKDIEVDGVVGPNTYRAIIETL